MILLLIDTPRNPLMGTVGRSPTCLQEPEPETRTSVDTRLLEPYPPVTKYTWHWIMTWIFPNCMKYYHFIVIIHIVTTAVAISSLQEIRKVFHPSRSWVDTDCVLVVVATSQDYSVLQLDGTGITKNLLFMTNYQKILPCLVFQKEEVSRLTIIREQLSCSETASASHQ